MEKSLEHTRWNCKYHVVWSPKYRRKIIYGKYRSEIGKILRRLCEYRGIEIVEANACIDPYSYVFAYTSQVQCCSDYGLLKG